MKDSAVGCSGTVIKYLNHDNCVYARKLQFILYDHIAKLINKCNIVKQTFIEIEEKKFAA